MRTAVSKAEIESAVADRFVDAFKIHEKAAPALLATGVGPVDELVGGIPRGGLTEIFGRASSGRTSLMFSILANATIQDEICALVDTSNSFAPTSAVSAGIDFEKLLWIRCGGNIEYGFKATDMLLHAGGFGLVILDMGDVPGKDARRIITSWWYRFRRSVENKPTAMVLISEESCMRSCAALTWELSGCTEWANIDVSDSTGSLVSTGDRRNVVSIRNKILSEPSARVSHAELLRANSIKMDRRRPITSGVNVMGFKAVNEF